MSSKRASGASRISSGGRSPKPTGGSFRRSCASTSPTSRSSAATASASRTFEPEPLFARALSGAGRRRDGQAALLRGRLLVGEEGESERHHSQGHTGALSRTIAGREEDAVKAKHWAALALACMVNAAWAQAQNYPNRAVRVVVAAQTGGPDTV